MPFPVTVVSGAPIQSVWGNTVVDCSTVGAWINGTGIPTSGDWGSNTPAGIASFQFTAKRHRRYWVNGVAEVQCTSGTDIANVITYVDGVEVCNFGTHLNASAVPQYGGVPMYAVFDNTGEAKLTTIDIKISISFGSGYIRTLRGHCDVYDLGPND